ncbi:hypothetical protein M9458_020311, partial [Cirrhinus mrigala]
ISIMTTSMERKRSLCVDGRNAHENRSLLRPSTCLWSTCVVTLGRSPISA